GFNFFFAHAGFLAHVSDRLFARPALCMNARIDNQANGTENFLTKASQVSKRIVVVPPDLFRQPFAVKRPAFHVSCKRNDLAKLWNAFEFLGRRDLPMMSRDALMISECWHAPFGHFAHVAEVREENSRAAAVHGAHLVVRTRGGCFLKLRNAPHFDLRARSGE